MSVDLSKASIAQWFAEREQHRCGYCKNPSGSISYGMYTESLTVEDYKDLIDRGWRRSGKYCYKPTMDKTCCPQYTIKCDAMEFSLNKSHKKVIKKFNKFLNDGILNTNIPPIQQDDETANEIPGYAKHSDIDLSKSITKIEDNLPDVKQGEASQGDEVAMRIANESSVKSSFKPKSMEGSIAASHASKSTKNPLKSGAGPDPNKPPCKKAKILRLEKKKEKLLQKGEEFKPANSKSNTPKNLSQFLEDVQYNAKHKLKTKLIPSSRQSVEWEEVKDVEFELYVKYQTLVHNDSAQQLSMHSFTRFLVTSPLQLVLARIDEDHEHFTASAELFKKYQMTVHNEPSAGCNRNEYIDFLVDTPLKPKPFPNGIDGPGYGSFHQQYWIDNKLIAVGVIDILPGCVSSVYFFYDPDYRDLTLGTYGTLREIQLIQNLHVNIPDLRYYYMGFYIHSCPKMRYKGKLNPSKLLCPETYAWIPIAKCLSKLEASKYSRLNEDLDAIDTNDCNSGDVDLIKVIYGHKLMYVEDFVKAYKEDRGVFVNLGNLVGKRSSHNILFWMG